MKIYHTMLLLFIISIWIHPLVLYADSFFNIRSIRSVTEIPGQQFTKNNTDSDKKDNKEREKVYFLQVTVQTQKRIEAAQVYVKAYFYDKNRVFLEKSDVPYPIERGTSGRYPMPVFFDDKENHYLYFQVSENVMKNKGWRSIIVFGDKSDADADIFPVGSFTSLPWYEFEERDIVFSRQFSKRNEIKDPVREYVLKTNLPQQPTITFFLRAPVIVDEISDADGVLAMCLLANSTGDIKRRLQEIKAIDEVGGVLRFAQDHNLVILCWGSSQLWDPRMNWDNLDAARARQLNTEFDQIASIWAKAVDEIMEKNKIHNRNFLLWGYSGSAQYAMRLALRQPKYFLAVHTHIPSSFDKPTLKAQNILWCLTTGENETGYQRSLDFYRACQKLRYKMIYKAVIGLGHTQHHLADELGLSFFEYALDFKKQREEGMAFSGFDNPMYVADIVNQEVFPIQQIGLVPTEYRTFLPTKELADQWME